MRWIGAVTLSLWMTAGPGMAAAGDTRTVALAAGQTEAYLPLVKQGERLKVAYQDFWCDAASYIEEASERVEEFRSALARLAPESLAAQETRRDAGNILEISAREKFFLFVGSDALKDHYLSAPAGEERTTVVRDCISRADVEKINNDIVLAAKEYIEAFDQAAARLKAQDQGVTK